MLTSPKIITVDTTGSIARIVRATADLLDRSIMHIDMTTGEGALAFLQQHPASLLITAVELDDNMKGYQLALEARHISPQTQVVILAESTDPELDAAELASDSPYVYLHRPVDLIQFARIITAGLNESNIFAAQAQPTTTTINLGGPLPYMDEAAASPIVENLLKEVGPMAIVIASRSGEVLMERGAVGYLDREKLSQALLPMFSSAVDMGDLVGGQTKTLHFYDGTEYDVFVLSVGLHHFLCLAFSGESGNRAFGAVNRFGRRAAEDLTALLGASAFIITPAQPSAPIPGQRPARRQPVQNAAEAYQPIERAPVAPVTEDEPLQLDPIADLDLSIFDQLDTLSDQALDDLFSPDKLADLANRNDRKGGPIDFDQAQELGIMPGLDN